MPSGPLRTPAPRLLRYCTSPAAAAPAPSSPLAGVAAGALAAGGDAQAAVASVVAMQCRAQGIVTAPTPAVVPGRGLFAATGATPDMAARRAASRLGGPSDTPASVAIMALCGAVSGGAVGAGTVSGASSFLAPALVYQYHVTGDLPRMAALANLAWSFVDAQMMVLRAWRVLLQVIALCRPLAGPAGVAPASPTPAKSPEAVTSPASISTGDAAFAPAGGVSADRLLLSEHLLGRLCAQLAAALGDAKAPSTPTPHPRVVALPVDRGPGTDERRDSTSTGDGGASRDTMATPLTMTVQPRAQDIIVEDVRAMCLLPSPSRPGSAGSHMDAEMTRTGARV